MASQAYQASKSSQSNPTSSSKAKSSSVAASRRAVSVPIEEIHESLVLAEKGSAWDPLSHTPASFSSVGPLSRPLGDFWYCHQDQVVLEPCLRQLVFEQSHRCSDRDELTMLGRKNRIARHPSPCYIGRASAGHSSKPVNSPAGDRTVSRYLLGYRPYSFRCPADLRPVVAATSAEKTPILDILRTVTGRCSVDRRKMSGRSPFTSPSSASDEESSVAPKKIHRALPMPDIGRAM